MKNAIFLFFWIFFLGVLDVSGQTPTAKKVFTYSYDNAGNRVKREWILLSCPNCRTYSKDSTKVLDSLYAIAQKADIMMPEKSTETLLYIQDTELKNIYPNPTNGNFVLQFTDILIDGVLNIYDLYGNILDVKYLSGMEFQIDISLFPAGEYLIVIQTPAGKKYSKKIIKI